MSRGLWVVLLVLATAAGAHADRPRIDPLVIERVSNARSHDPALREDTFAKMGGSSVVSKAFLHCFATPYVDLGDHEDLAATIDYFGAGRRNAFNRESEAAGVSWNLRYALGGRPANFRQELRATRARWALVLFGGNDAQNQNERIYLKRLLYLVEALESLGVVPVLGSALPRRSRNKDRWIRRFNAITEAVATHWGLPYIDYYAALEALPKKGLARDGVHPNVLPPGGLKRACVLTEEGLRYGNNLRNLLTLEMLDALRRTAGEDADAGAGEDADADAGAASGSFPVSFLLDKPSLPPLSALPARCGAPKPGSRYHRTRLTLVDRARLRASALDPNGQKPRVYWVRITEDGGRCVRRRLETLEVDVPAGMWDLIVEVPESAADEGRMLVLIYRDPR